MSNYSGVVIESQPDWLTASAHGDKSAKALLDLAVGLAKEEAARGNRPRKWRSMGYEGLACGRVQYGQRDQAATEIRLSGDAANEFLAPALALADRVTRLDLAVTWRADQPALDLGRESYAEAIEFHKHKPRSALPWSVNDGDGGWTTYIGERRSEYHCRIYNKEAQERKQMGKRYDGRYDRCWRYELELKGTVPLLVLKKYTTSEHPSGYIQGYVHSYGVAHGLTIPFDPAGGQKLIPGFRRASDEDTKLFHLQRNVRPTVSWLTDRVGRAEVLRALGLEDSNQTVTRVEPHKPTPTPTMTVVGLRDGPPEGGADGTDNQRSNGGDVAAAAELPGAGQ